MSMSYKDDCREALGYLCERKQKLEDKRTWKKGDAERYENLEAYCRAIHGALEIIEYYEEREAVLIDRFGKEAVDDAGKAWLSLKIAQGNERFGIDSGEKQE